MDPGYCVGYELGEREHDDFHAFAFHKFRGMTDGVGDDEFRHGAIVETLDDRFRVAGKYRMRREAKYSFRSGFFRRFGVGYHRASRINHVVDKNHVFAFDRADYFYAFFFYFSGCAVPPLSGEATT
jgi:hypothetical protein